MVKNLGLNRQCSEIHEKERSCVGELYHVESNLCKRWTLGELKAPVTVQLMRMSLSVHWLCQFTPNISPHGGQNKNGWQALFPCQYLSYLYGTICSYAERSTHRCSKFSSHVRYKVTTYHITSLHHAYRCYFLMRIESVYS